MVTKYQFYTTVIYMILSGVFQINYLAHGIPTTNSETTNPKLVIVWNRCLAGGVRVRTLYGGGGALAAAGT